MNKSIIRIFTILLSTLVIFSISCHAKEYKSEKKVNIIKALIEQGKIADAIGYYKTINSPEVNKWIIKNNTKLEPPFLYILSDKIFDKDKDNAMFWFSVGKYRSYYDAFRCVDTSAQQGRAFLPMYAPNTAKYINEHTEKLIEITPKVIEFDKKYPPTNSPRWICAHGINNFINGADTGYIDKSEWPALKEKIETNLMKSIEIYKKKVEEQKKLEASDSTTK